MNESSGLQRLADVIGDRGERIFELAITDYEHFSSPLFKPSFLGEKWAAVDYYVELLGVRTSDPFFFAQIKSTSKPLDQDATVLEITVPLAKCRGLFRIPGRPMWSACMNRQSELSFFPYMRCQTKGSTVSL